MTFNLRDLTHEVLRDTDDADPGSIAGQVLARIPAEDRQEALAQTLRGFVRTVISEQRNSEPVKRSTPGTSWKGSGIRAGWKRRLADRIEGCDGWVLLRNATFSDLTKAADDREEMALRNASRAAMYRSFADAVHAAGVETFGDLPTETQEQLLDGAS